MRANLAFRFYVWSCGWLAAITVSLCVSAASPEVSQLISQFQAEPYFWKQNEIANEIAKVATVDDLSLLEPWLTHEDRHIRGNVAYLFAKLGDGRGLATIEDILVDNSADRHVEWQGGSLVSTGNPEEAMAAFLRSPAALRAQIKTDRYYAVHLLGELRDRRAVDVLISLLDHDDVNYNAAWALGEIGDARAIPALIAALSNTDALVRVSAIDALEKLRATQALPYLTALFGDPAVPNAGEQVAVGTTARRAAESIRRTGSPR
jgi:HEAT repeat protein